MKVFLIILGVGVAFILLLVFTLVFTLVCWTMWEER